MDLPGGAAESTDQGAPAPTSNRAGGAREAAGGAGAASSAGGRLLDGKLWILAAGEAASRGFGFLAMTYLFRRLGPAHYGYVEATVAVMMLALILTELGLPVLGTRNVARDPASAPELLRRVATAQLAAAAGVLAALAAAAFLLPLDPVLRTLLVGFGAALLLTPVALQWLFQGQERMAAVSVPKALRYVVFLAVAVAVVDGPEDAVLLPAAELAGAAAMGAACLVALRLGGGRFRIGGRGSLDGALVREALPICGSTVVWALRTYVAVVFLGIAAGAAAAGTWGAAHRVVMVFLGVLEVYFVNLFPRLSVAAAGRRAGLRRLLARSLHLTGWPALAFAAAMPFAAPWAMRTIYGSEVGEGGTILGVLCWLVPVIAVRAHGRFALIALGRQRWDLVYSVAGVVALFALLPPCTSAWGVAGAAWAVVASEVIATVLGWVVLARLLREPDLPTFSGDAGGPMTGEGPGAGGRDAPPPAAGG